MRCGAVSQQQTVGDGCDIEVAETLLQGLCGEGTVEDYECCGCEAAAVASGGTAQDRPARRPDASTVRTVREAQRVLEIRVKRFTIGHTGQGEKVNTHIAYTRELAVGEGKYQLRAVAVHHGASCASGHYTTYVRKGRAWYHADDGDVNETTEEEALGQQAYMLWYCRDEADETGDDGAGEAAAGHGGEASAAKEAPDALQGGEHQCPPLYVRVAPVGTSVRVAGRARRQEGEQHARISAAGEEGAESSEEHVWSGVVAGHIRKGGDYLITPSAPIKRRKATRVAWTNITITGGPPAGSESAKCWLDYERLRAEETEGRGGSEESWMDERRRCAAEKREHAARRRAEMARREAVYEVEQAVRTERGAKFQTTHKRLREEPGPRGTKPLVAHAGGVITTNKEEALGKFVARMSRVADERAEEGSSRQEEREEGAVRAKRARAAAQAIAMLEERKRERETVAEREVEDKRAQRMLRRNSRAWQMENGDDAAKNVTGAGGARKRKAEEEGAGGGERAVGGGGKADGDTEGKKKQKRRKKGQRSKRLCEKIRQRNKKGHDCNKGEGSASAE